MDGFSFSQFLLFSSKKILGAILTPSSLLFILAVLALVLLLFSRPRGFIRMMLLTILLGSGLAHPWGALSLIAPLEHRYPTQLVVKPEIRHIAVLGSAYLHAPQQPPTAMISLHGQGRLVEGVRLYHLLKQASPAPLKFIVSGYKGGHNPEQASYVKAAAEFVMALGVEPEDIVQLGQPRTTAEEAQALAKTLGATPFYLVTSAYHMPRAMGLMQAQALNPVAAPTALYSLISAGPWMLPRASALSLSDIAVHEYLGLVWAYAVGNIEVWPW